MDLDWDFILDEFPDLEDLEEFDLDEDPITDQALILGFELPENWSELTEDQKQAWLNEKMFQDLGSEAPALWNILNDEDKLTTYKRIINFEESIGQYVQEEPE